MYTPNSYYYGDGALVCSCCNADVDIVYYDFDKQMCVDCAYVHSDAYTVPDVATPELRARERRARRMRISRIRRTIPIPEQFDDLPF